MGKRSKRTITIIVCLALCFSMLTGCKKEEQQKPSSGQVEKQEDKKEVKQDEKQTDQKTEDKVEPEKAQKQGEILGANLKYDTSEAVNDNQEITISFWYPDDVKAICEKYVKEYESIHPNVKVETSVSPWDDYWNKLPVAITSGTGPDLFWMHNAYTDTMKTITEPLPESIFPLDALKKDFRQVELHSVDGKINYIDTGLMSSCVLYNKKMWADAGLTDADLPKTWDDLVSAAKKLTKKDKAGNIIVSGFNYNGESTFAQLLIAMNYQKGVFQFSEDGKSSLYNNPTVIENMNYLKSWYTDEGIGDTKGDLCRDAFGQQQTAMIWEWTWVPNYIKSTFPEVDFGIISTPSFDQNPAAYDRNNGECSPCVSKNAKDSNKAVAFDFVKYLLCNDDFLKEFALMNGIFPSKYSLDDNQEINNSDVHKALKQTIGNTIWPGPIPSQVESAQSMYLQDEFLKNGATAEDAAKKADEVLSKDLSHLTFAPVERKYEHADRFNN